MDRKQIFRSQLEARISEVEEYQINIDNYRLALQMISEMSATDQAWLAPFIDQLNNLLSSSLFEQKKAQIMLDVIKLQLGEE